MSRIETAFNGVLKWINVICGVLICLMSVHIVIDVLGRYLFDAPLSGTIEFVQYYYMMSVIFLPLPYLQFRRLHFAATAFTDAVPQWALRGLLFLGDALTAVLCVTTAWQSLLVAITKTAVGEHIVTAHSVVLQWPGRWLVTVGFLLMGVAACLGMIGLVRGSDTGARPAVSLRSDAG